MQKNRIEVAGYLASRPVRRFSSLRNAGVERQARRDTCLQRQPTASIALCTSIPATTSPFTEDIVCSEMPCEERADC